ncbi:hypothetical protein QT971_01225 [Microcoleus sp. herbarium19]
MFCDICRDTALLCLSPDEDTAMPFPYQDYGQDNGVSLPLMYKADRES